MQPDEIKTAICRDMEWHANNKDMTKNEDWEKGFLAGMRQALIVIDLVTNADSQCGMALG